MNVFNLDSSKLNELMYNMENQNKDSSVNITTGEIIYDFDGTESEILYPLPKWGPVDGFRIMNEFVSSLKNPIVKEELKNVLNQGTGVFRKFKNVLKSSPEIEKVWYTFKKDEIKSKVLNWYNQIREYAGLSLYDYEDFEFDEDLLDFDFEITAGTDEDLDFILENDKLGFYELYSHYPIDVIDDIYLRKREGMLNTAMFSSDNIVIAKNPSGEKVGFVWTATFSLGKTYTGMDLLQLYVTPEYRGLGIGKTLLNSSLKEYKKGGYKDFIVNCQGQNSWLITYLELEGYKLQFQELIFRL